MKREAVTVEVEWMLLCLWAMFFDVVIHEVEVLVADINLIVGEDFSDFDDVAPSAAFHAVHGGEVGIHGSADSGVDAQSHHGRPPRCCTCESGDGTQFLCLLGLLGNLFVIDAVLVHREENDVFAAIHACHNGIAKEDEKGEKGDEDENGPCVIP